MILTTHRPPPRRRPDPIFGVRRRASPEPQLGAAAALCRAVAPADLAGLPVYIVPKRRIPPELGGDALAGGFTNPCLDLVLKGVIGPAWRGRGPCVVADDRRPEFAEVVAHELAHVLDRGEPFHPTGLLTPADLFEVYTPDLAGMSRESWRGYQPDGVLAGHGPQFFRVLVHVLHRAAAAGWSIYGGFAHGYEGAFSPLAAYRDALGDEPERMSRASFKAIRGTLAPPALTSLWHEDSARFHAARGGHQ